MIALSKKDSKSITPIYVELENFKGVNDKADLAHAEEIMGMRIKKALMQQGVIMHLPQTIYIQEGAKFVGECNL